jgi:hypothetical protein
MRFYSIEDAKALNLLQNALASMFEVLPRLWFIIPGTTLDMGINLDVECISPDIEGIGPDIECISPDTEGISP